MRKLFAIILLTFTISCNNVDEQSINNCDIQETSNNIPSTNDILILDKYGIIAVTNEWSSIAYGNEKYIAVSNKGYFTTSLDGTNWKNPHKTHNDIDELCWENITFGNGKFVISGNFKVNGISVSEFGDEWSNTIPYSGNGRMIIENDICIICNNFCIYTWDKDFTHKEQVEPSYDNARVDYYDVTFGNGKFVLLSSCANDGDVFTSIDGLNWKRLFTEISCQCITFDGKQFIAGGGGGRILTSIDGEVWTENRALPSNFLPYKIKYKNGNYIIIGTLNRDWFVNQFISTSTDGINWSDLEKVTDSSIQDFTFI